MFELTCQNSACMFWIAPVGQPGKHPVSSVFTEAVDPAWSTCWGASYPYELRYVLGHFVVHFEWHSDKLWILLVSDRCRVVFGLLDWPVGFLFIFFLSTNRSVAWQVVFFIYCSHVQVTENGGPAKGQVTENGSPAKGQVTENGSPAKGHVTENGSPAISQVTENGSPARSQVTVRMGVLL